MDFCGQGNNPSSSIEFLNYLSVEYQEGLGSVFYDDVSIQSILGRRVGSSADNELEVMWKEAAMF